MGHEELTREPTTLRYDLPPTQRARPLPALPTSRKAKAAAAKVASAKKALPGGKGAASKSKPSSSSAAAELLTSAGEPSPSSSSSVRKNLKRKRASAGGDQTKKDDAPRAFQRIMAAAQGKRVRSGLDDGRPRAATGGGGGAGGKRKGADSTDAAAAGGDDVPVAADHVAAAAPKPAVPTIRPGERLSDFAARVDAAIPISGLVSKNERGAAKDVAGLKIFRTKKERKMHKLYDEWRAQDKRIRDRREEEAEEREEELAEVEEQAGVGVGGVGSRTGGMWRTGADGDEDVAGAEKAGGRKRKGKRRGGGGGGAGDLEADPWEELKRKRGEAKLGLHDVAQAPPDFGRKAANPYGGLTLAGVPKAAGSLRSREMVQEERTKVMEKYREMVSAGKTRN